MRFGFYTYYCTDTLLSTSVFISCRAAFQVDLLSLLLFTDSSLTFVNSISQLALASVVFSRTLQSRGTETMMKKLKVRATHISQTRCYTEETFQYKAADVKKTPM